MNIYAVSDLHVDYPENRQWVARLAESCHRDDVLIVAGDVSDQTGLLEETLRTLKSGFKHVCFVPGNHDLWTCDEYDCSLQKFEALQTLCQRLGVETGVLHLDSVSIIPLHSWYDFSFGEPDRYLRRAWRDFRACHWPAPLHNEAELTKYFLALNEAHLQLSNDTVISFSHFLPHLDVMPAQIPEHRRKVYPVLGSHKLGEQLRRLQPDIHVYGHSHVNRDIELDDIRYINNAFAYPAEHRIARKQLHLVYQAAAITQSESKEDSQ